MLSGEEQNEEECRWQQANTSQGEEDDDDDGGHGDIMGLRAVTRGPGWREDEKETAKRISSPAASPCFTVPPKPQPATFL